jgi:hypothetical protein
MSTYLDKICVAILIFVAINLLLLLYYILHWRRRRTPPPSGYFRCSSSDDDDSSHEDCSKVAIKDIPFLALPPPVISDIEAMNKRFYRLNLREPEQRKAGEAEIDYSDSMQNYDKLLEALGFENLSDEEIEEILPENEEIVETHLITSTTTWTGMPPEALEPNWPYLSE